MSEENAYLRRMAAKKALTPSHRRAPKQEEQLAARLKGSRVPGSGAGSMKGDVRAFRVLRVEAKTTKSNSFSVTREMVRKIEEAAASGGELPAIVVEFNDGAGKKQLEVAVVPMYVLDAIAEGHRG